MHLWRTTACGIMVCVLAGLAPAERATSILDDLETALQDAAEELAEDTTKAGKKRRKTAELGLRRLGKDTASEKADLKLLKKIAGLTLKRFADDVDVVGPIEDAAVAFDASIVVTLEAASARVPADPAKKKVKPRQVENAIARAQRLLDKSRAKATRQRINVLFKARVAADKALNLANRLPDVEPEFVPDGTTFYILPLAAGGAQVIATDQATESDTVLDVGLGEVQLADPPPVGADDGGAFAFQRGAQMVVVDTSGDEPAIAASVQQCEWEFSSWSPDSSVLIAAGQDPDTIIVIDRSGTTLHTFDDRVYRGFPVEETFLWSPDGTLVAYRTDRDLDGVKELRVLDPETGVVTEVTSDNLSTDQIRYVAWAGKVNALVYPADFERSSSDVEVMSVRADGTERTVVSQEGQDARDSGSSVATVKTNPAGDGVLYEFRQDGSGFLGTANLDGSSPAVIATASANFINVSAWSPGGDRIAYIDDGMLFTVRPDGTGTQQVATDCTRFRWAPDGSALFFRDGRFVHELFMCAPDGTAVERVSPELGPGGNVDPEFTVRSLDDGLLVIFGADADENARQDIHVVVVPRPGPAKDSVKIFSEILLSAARFQGSGYELKRVRSYFDGNDLDGFATERFRTLQCDGTTAYIRTYRLARGIGDEYVVRRVSEKIVPLEEADTAFGY